jgi:hypothetical protein
MLFADTLTIALGSIIILMLIAFIVGLVVGVSMGRPNVVR